MSVYYIIIHVHGYSIFGMFISNTYIRYKLKNTTRIYDRIIPWEKRRLIFLILSSFDTGKVQNNPIFFNTGVF